MYPAVASRWSGPGTPNWLDAEDDEDDPSGRISGVREVGFRRSGNHLVPIVHSKILLLGQMWWHDAHPSGGVADIYGFRPQRLWVGSANFTKSSGGGLEMGLWTSDPRLLAAARQYLLALVALSEPLDEGPDVLTPDLIAVQYDDEAFAEYLAELESILGRVLDELSGLRPRRHGLVHGDLIADNMLFVEGASPGVIDFGS